MINTNNHIAKTKIKPQLIYHTQQPQNNPNKNTTHNNYNHKSQQHNNTKTKQKHADTNKQPVILQSTNKQHQHTNRTNP